MRSILLFLALILFSGTLFSQSKSAPKLVVGIVVDQMVYDYLYRFQDRFSKGGFLKLMNEGTNCRNTQYNYVPTFTGPGHASIYTGTTPNQHGIVGNDWYDRDQQSAVNCVTDSSVNSVGTESNDGLRSPRNLNCMTITDQLKVTYAKSKVISVSIKDRSAVLPGGHMSDGSYWYDYATGKFITSDFYKKQLPAYVDQFNQKEYPKSVMGNTWNTLYPIETYSASGPDDTRYEVVLPNKTSATFPYNFNAIATEKSQFNLFTITPWANTYLTDFALTALVNENLGKGEASDFLCISYSTPDIAGHAFGPYSVEMEDMYLRLDLEIQRLLEAIKQQVGKNAVVFLTADHAVVPVPEWLTDHHLPGGYAFLKENMLELQEAVKVKFGADFIAIEENNNIYLNEELIDFMEADKSVIENFIAKEVRKWEGVKYVFTSEDLSRASAGDQFAEMVKNGFDPIRSGNVLFMLAPGYLPKSADSESSRKGTSHGSPYNYDTHVPLLWYGKNIPKQEIFERVEITDIVPTLTHILNLQKPACTTGEPILPILNKKK
ncbi:MAG: alkaline phosphatase family protein [Crocinitomicaceae bacterium]